MKITRTPISVQQLLSLEAPPSPLSSRPERSAVERPLCGCSSLEMFFDRGIMGLRPTQGDGKRLLFGNDCRWEHRPPLSHLDRSAAQWRDLCVDALPWKCFSTGGSVAEAPAVSFPGTHLGVPQPPPPGVSMCRMSPLARCWLHLPGKVVRSSPACVATHALPEAPSSPPCKP
jgi:hypothetical protein